jgi:hypothetical protein
MQLFLFLLWWRVIILNYWLVSILRVHASYYKITFLFEDVADQAHSVTVQLNPAKKFISLNKKAENKNSI